MSKPAKQKYKTMNWYVYSQALKARGSLTVWLDGKMAWQGTVQRQNGSTDDLQRCGGAMLRYEPYTRIGLVRICAGGAQQWASLPQSILPSVSPGVDRVDFEKCPYG